MTKSHFFFLIIISLVLISWGHNGHERINHHSSLSFSPEMQQFLAWTDSLAAHASEADDRKATDPDEAPRHFIDIDNYTEFLAEGRIPQTYDSVVALYGEDFVIGQGILPWATITTYDSLVKCFQRRDWAKAVLFASDLGHYVADGHMPLHITRNYNGQYSGNYGIHWRYETGMIDLFLEDINYDGDNISMITDVNGYVFSYLYLNYTYTDSVIAADDYARVIAGNTNSPEYSQALWDMSKSYTVPLFSRASHALAELIYSAWTEAGKPLFNPSGIFNPAIRSNNIHLQVSPNPFKEFARVEFTLPGTSPVSIEILDVNGIVMATPVNSYLTNGSQKIYVDLKSLPPGLYIVSVKAGKVFGAVKMIKV